MAVSPREVLFPEGFPPPEGQPGRAPAPFTERPAWSFSADAARRSLAAHLRVASLCGFGLDGHDAATAAAGALLAYLEETQKAALTHMDRVRFVESGSSLLLDAATRRNLELVRNMADGTSRATLLSVVDRTATAMGGRALRERLLAPLVDRAQIEARLDAVGTLVAQPAHRGAIRDHLGGIGDLERLLSRAVLGTATPRDLGGMRASLRPLPALRAALAEACSGLASPGTRALESIAASLPDLGGLSARLEAALGDELPSHAREGGFVRDGFDPVVDETRALSRDARGSLAAIEARERERTGIASLKVRYNRVFGYYIEISKSQLRSVPEGYERRQTLVGGERFITPELKDYEERVLTAQERLVEREVALFEELRGAIAAEAGAIRAAAGAIASLDVAASLAETAAARGWCRPTIDDGASLRITAGRHPVVEDLVAAGTFVANDLSLDAGGDQIALITGPNMGGKSTYLRQTALIVILAQAGSFVPAAAAHVGLVDRVFSRVGASDNLAGGQSTFLVEMTETANILNSATPRSLVLLDEIGRGTSTFDGLSLAWAIAEHLHDTPAVAARTLFATHYHELTELAVTRPRVVNLHIAAREFRGELVFLRSVSPGAADQSYGIQVARLAGIPPAVIDRAREVLEVLEKGEIGPNGTPRLARSGEAARQLPLFAGETPADGEPARHREASTPLDPGERAALDALRALEPERMTPLEALNSLATLRSLAQGRGGKRGGGDGGSGPA
jgi:DNA mismatch repair protein MutS